MNNLYSKRLGQVVIDIDVRHLPRSFLWRFEYISCIGKIDSFQVLSASIYLHNSSVLPPFGMDNKDAVSERDDMGIALDRKVCCGPSYDQLQSLPILLFQLVLECIAIGLVNLNTDDTPALYPAPQTPSCPSRQTGLALRLPHP